jgi:hypothetical protein
MSSALRLAVPLYFGINLRLRTAGRLVLPVGKQHSDGHHTQWMEKWVELHTSKHSLTPYYTTKKSGDSQLNFAR